MYQNEIKLIEDNDKCRDVIMKPINTDVIHMFWDGKVVIEEVKSYDDSRGNLVEVWRDDDRADSKMSYWSITKPYIMRGPHEHKNQQDYFIVWYSKMSYHLYNKKTDEMRVFITDPNRVYRIFVDVGIIHSYRNLQSKDAITGNFPTSLFMGYNKKESIDEIRWECKFQSNQTIIVLGAAGRLGQSLTKTLFDNMGSHNYHVIPIYERFNDSDDVYNLFVKLDNALTDFETKKIESNRVTVINCIAYANVQNSQIDNEEIIQKIRWSNLKLPIVMLKMSAQREWNFINFSTDYVYQKIKDDANIHSTLGRYTTSKQKLEYELNNLPNALTKYCSIIRVCNLFSINDGECKHNIFKKFNKMKNKVSILRDLSVSPTDVDSLSNSVLQNIDKIVNSEKLSYWNMSTGIKYDMKEFVDKFYNFEIIKEKCSDILPWMDNFMNDPNCNQIRVKHNENKILNYVKSLQYDRPL